MIRSPLTAEERLRNRVEALEGLVAELQLTARGLNEVQIAHGQTLDEHSDRLDHLEHLVS